MSAAGNSATNASTGNFGDEGNMAEAGRRVGAPDIALATGAGSAKPGQPANRQMAQTRGRVPVNCHRRGATPCASLSLRHE